MAYPNETTIIIDAIPHRIEGDWHDRPLRYGVFGPYGERQDFSTKKEARRYASIRRRSADQAEAMKKYSR